MALPGTPCARLRGSMLAALLTISMLIGLAITATASGSPARLGFHVLRPTAVVGQLTASRRGVDEHHTHAAIHRAIPKAHEDGAYVYDGVVKPSVQTCSPHSSRASSDRAVEPVHREDGRGVRLRAPPVLAAESGSGLVDGANGALRDPATGRFAPNPDRVAPEPSSGLHGNSRLSDATTFLYRRVTNDGGFQKWGITNSLKGRYSSTELGTDQLIPMTYGSRSDMVDLERWLVESDPGPLNGESWAGATG